ncbi:RDD family protein [Streptomyces sp. S07_1.15]|uniref:RDD family protein n=1 Tax=Streptomyces sp. S07_1.15 TaxID=2873925 RepID=UPI001D158546|nr:RDD family protein [Streptomyces sp. S07_1.15]MCC3653593.1 RDD family protein [Streptomyces sp. S07_1.15]
MSELVTGEAVVLGLRPAKLPSRTLAVVIDLLVAFALYVAVTMALTAAVSSLDEAAQAAVSVAAFMLILVGVPIAVETLTRGRSLGKLVCGLRVVRDDGGPIRFRHALVRGAVGAVEIIMTFGVIAVIASLVSARGRRLGDVFAGTLVVRERVPAQRTGAVPQAPPWLHGRFTGLDLSRVPDALWLAIRQYLTRMDQLDPDVGGPLAQRLAADLAAATGAPVPADVPPAMYLAGVVSERQTRDAQRVLPVAAGAQGYGEPGSGGPGGASVGGMSGWAAPSGAAPGPGGLAGPGGVVAPAPAGSPGVAGVASGSAGRGGAAGDEGAAGRGGSGGGSGPRTGFVPPG